MWQRSVKRKLDQIEVGVAGGGDVAARVEVENEVSALRETLARQQETIQDLSLELDEERNAASTAASEAMSMILRLQREKAEVQMEFRQFKRFAEERMDHDQQELVALDDLLFKREQTVDVLAHEIKSYKHRLMSYRTDGNELDAQNFDLPDFDYPQLRCSIRDEIYDDDSQNLVLERYMPPVDHLQNLETRIYELEAEKKGVVRPDLALIRNLEEEFKVEEEEEEEEVSAGGEHSSDDDENARVYTIDAVHAVSTTEVSNEDEGAQDSGTGRENWDEDTRENVAETRDIKKLYMRLQSLEADRESMRQAILSMRTEKAQLLLLKEIAQQLCKEAAPEKKRIMKKSSFISIISFVAVIKVTFC